MTVQLPNNRPVIDTTNDISLSNIVTLIDSYLHQTFLLYKQNGLDEYNEPIYNDPVTIYGYFERSPKTITNDAGMNVHCTGMIYLPLSCEINLPNDYLEFEGERLVIEKRITERHFRNSHYILYIR